MSPELAHVAVRVGARAVEFSRARLSGMPDPVRLLAISDLHVALQQNRKFVEELAPSRDDWLVLGGDVCESEADLDFVLRTLAPRFARLVWVPGNHELWTLAEDGARGVAKYERLVATCRRYGALTPEDPYERWPGDGPPLVVAPLFLLYDYSFRPDHVAAEQALAWAAEHGIVCADEHFLHPDPFPTRSSWCAARCEQTERRLSALPDEVGTILVNHFPLLREHAFLPRVPRFSIWCGTRRTEDWHVRFHAKAVVYGHLHIRRQHERDGVTFHEVSLGYRRQWNPETPERYVRVIWPPCALDSAAGAG